MLALHFMWYNLACVHETRRGTPRDGAGAGDYVWTKTRNC